MAEILTESFCERCGTRYTFETPKPRRVGIGRIRTLTRGVRNFVANDSTSFADAMAAAREDLSRSASQLQLDAFRETFNFCMSCRQYTCRACWNESAGECLSCTPDLRREGSRTAFPDLPAVVPIGSARPDVPEPAWPTSDLRPVVEIFTRTELASPHDLQPAEPHIAEEPEAPLVALSGVEAPVAAVADAAEAEAGTVVPETAVAAPEPGTPLEVAATFGESTTTAPETDLTAEELAAIQGALGRHLPAPLDAGPGPVSTETGEASGVLAAAAVETASETVHAVPPVSVPAEPLVGARAATRQLLRRFRPRPNPPVPAATVLASASDAERPSVEAAGLPRPGEAARAPASTDLAIPAPAKVPAALPAHEAAAGEPAQPDAPIETPASDVTKNVPAAPTLIALPEISEVAAAVPASVSPGPESGTPAEPTPATPAADHVAQPIWRIVAPEGGSPTEPPPAPGRWGAPPAGGRRGADAVPSSPWAARVATARPLESPVWAASSRDVLAAQPSGAARPVGIQSCATCGLSLSANARFCRRCGARQA